MTQTSNLPLLIVCVVGIYASFITWGVLLEQISSQKFGDEEHFHAPFVVNLVQNLVGFLVGWAYVVYQERGTKKEDRVGAFDVSLLKSVALVALTQSLSSPIGFSATEHVDFMLYQLTKSCKLIPVMLVHFFMYRTRFPLYKYLVAGAVTAGVVMFSMSGKKHKKNETSEGNVVYGLMLLSVSLVLDGVTNAAQDAMFKKNKKLTGAHLQCSLNFVSFWMTLVYAGVVTNQLQYSLDFIYKYPSILKEIGAYAVCGAMGQIFIFVTLSQFGSIALITVTVTRKMISMLLSVVLFGHQLSIGQWWSLLLVFAGIGYEALVKLQSTKIEKIEKKEK